MSARHESFSPDPARSIREVAVGLAGRGWPVFPCRIDKRPATKHGFKDASNDSAEVDRLFRLPGAESIGIATGPSSGLWVLDVDLPDGPQSLRALQDQHGPLPFTWRQRTGSGGRHYFFRWPEGGEPIRNSVRTKLGPGLDVRGEGGYVVVAPSPHPSGNAYAWERGFSPEEMELADAPDWLLELVRPAKPAKRPRHSQAIVRPQSGGCTRYGRAALEAETDRVRTAPEGQRNQELNRAAFAVGQLVAGGELDRATVEAELKTAARVCGLSDAEVVRTIASGMASGMALPRQASPKQERARLPAVDDAYGFELTEDGLASAFERRFRDGLRYDHDLGRWFVWDGGRWAQNRTDLAFSWARRICRELNVTRSSILAKAATAAAVERFARAAPCFAVTSEAWDAAPMLLGTPGGTIDLQTGMLRHADRTDLITKSTAVAPADRADCPQWQAFLDQTTRGDVDLKRFLQQVAGYCLTGDTREHALFFIYGPGGNGKSVFLNVLANILGDYRATASMETFTASKRDQHPTDLAMLKGARLVTASETEEGKAWAESRIKSMTGGDPITARFMRQDFFTYMPQFKLVIVGNHKPVLKNVDDAARRRFNIVPFIHKPDRPDFALEDKLRDEYPVILRWMIDGCLDWQANRLTRPAVVADATAAYFDDQDLFGQWVAERCETGPRKLDPAARLFESWKRFAEASGEPPGSMKTFSAAMIKRGFAPSREWFNGATARLYRGLAVRIDHGEHDA